MKTKKLTNASLRGIKLAVKMLKKTSVKVRYDKMYTTGAKVKRGSYWSPIDGSSLILGSEGILVGTENNKYIKVSSPLTLLVSPLFGVMYVMFMPIFGLVVMVAIASIPVLGTIVSLLGQIFSKSHRVRHYSHRTHRKYVI